MSDIEYQLMRVLAKNPELSQREIARELGVSLGNVNTSIRELVRKRWIKLNSFTNKRNKAAYMYLLTPRGLEQRAQLTVKFLEAKLRECEALRSEVEQITREAQMARSNRRQPVGVAVALDEAVKSDS